MTDNRTPADEAAEQYREEDARIARWCKEFIQNPSAVVNFDQAAMLLDHVIPKKYPMGDEGDRNKDKDKDEEEEVDGRVRRVFFCNALILAAHRREIVTVPTSEISPKEIPTEALWDFARELCEKEGLSTALIPSDDGPKLAGQSSPYYITAAIILIADLDRLPETKRELRERVREKLNHILLDKSPSTDTIRKTVNKYWDEVESLKKLEWEAYERGKGKTKRDARKN